MSANPPPTYIGTDASGYAHFREADGSQIVVAPNSMFRTKGGHIISNQNFTASPSGLLVPPATPSTGANQWQYGAVPAEPEYPALPSAKRDMPVVGYRAWNFNEKFRLGYGKRITMGSTGMTGQFWQQGINQAHCANAGGIPGNPTFSTAVTFSPYLSGRGRSPEPGHIAPDENCGCGFYVLADLDELESHVKISNEVIIGAVLGWGKVVQHGTEGWRAQYARILAFLDCKFSKEQDKITERAAHAYEVEIYQRDALEAYVKEWGDPFEA